MQADLVIAVIEALEAERLPYFLTGSAASMVYGIPRATKDVDFVVEVDGDGIDRLARRLAGRFEFDPRQHLETSTWTRRYILRSSRPVFEVELFIKSDDPHHLEQWSRRRVLRNPILGRDAWMPSPEDVVVQKLRWGRPKDIADVEAVIGVQGAKLDWPYIERWCDAHGSRKRLDEVKASIPPDLLE
jgi:hypothetical protein